MQSESTKKQVKAVWTILVMLTFWVVIHTVKLNTIVPDFNSVNKTINILLEKVNDIENDINELESIRGQEVYEEIYEEQSTLFQIESFPQRFCRMRSTFGSGAIFDWNGNLYTTYYAEELLTNNK